MIAESICKELKIKLNNNLTGITHSVFENAVNIITNDNGFITILTIDKPMAPYAIKLFNITSFIDYEIEKDMKVSFENEYIWFEDLNIKIILDKAQLWNPSPMFSYIKGKEDILTKLSIMEKYLLHSKSFFQPLINKLGQQYKWFEAFPNEDCIDEDYYFINERLLRFINAFIQEDESIKELAKAIIGYGQGLTPSIDDFICGLMVSRIYLSHYFYIDIDNALRLNSLIIEDIEGRTTRVSKEMLKFSAKGYVNEDIRNLIISLISNTSIEDFKVNLKKVASFGFSSGTDIISGMYTCSSLFFNHYIGGRYGKCKTQHKKEHLL
ncbi:MAG: hypothetical protein K0R09_3493 [Clostridiales bacterium]|jgi:hypothetical protein|nr:hypothetical protein [Clostridiales bacterium]